MSEAGGYWVGPPEDPDRYEITSPIHAGVEADVWSGYKGSADSGGRRRVAIRMSRPGEAPGHPAEEFFDDLTQLRHPNLVEVTDIFIGMGYHRRTEQSTERYRYVVMTLVDGMTLREWLSESPTASFAERVRVMRGVAAALDYLHSTATAGGPLVHADIKPDNIVVRRDNTPVLVDLGLLHPDGVAAAPGLTRAYAAPELRDARAPATQRTDAYSFLLVVAETVLGLSIPLDRAGWVDHRALLGELRAGKRGRDRITLAVEIRRAIEGPAEARPAALRLWLDRAVATRGMQTDVAPVPPSPGLRRHRLWQLTIVALLLVGVAVVGVHQLIGRAPTSSIATRGAGLDRHSSAAPPPVPVPSSPASTAPTSRSATPRTTGRHSSTTPAGRSIYPVSKRTAARSQSAHTSPTPLPVTASSHSSSRARPPVSAPRPTQGHATRTYAETTGSNANTWSDYRTAAGTFGAGIGAGSTIAISCAVHGYQVQDGNTWWYRIAQNPWNDAFYVSADAFYNNGATSGSLHGTPFVDPAVPTC